MDIKKNKHILFPLMIISIFVFIVSLASLYTERHISCGAAQTCTIPIPYLIPIIASMGLIIGTLVYYSMTEKITRKDINIDEYKSLISKILNKEERDIINIISKEKEISQAKITSISGIPRLKVFRIIEKLKDKGIIEKKVKGKTRIISIKEDMKNIFKD